VGEQYPHKGPFQDMSPAGLPGLLVIVVAAVCVWSLFPKIFWPVTGAISVLALVLALRLDNWRTHHPTDHDVLHLNSDSKNTKGRNV
jgi:hypothetical protein